MQIKCPELSDELITYLEAVYPDQAVDPSKKDPAVAFGNAEVIRHLKAVKQTQEETAYVPT
jgi:hypothetical protein